MTRDELERYARWLEQGLTLDRDAQKRLVAHALGAPTKHRDGCGFHRGDACDCRDGGPMDLGVKEALTQ